ncbi:Lat1p [Saccharomyces cerevisiae YJM1573]|uniref:Acetyltransferase component of pyruvate dehydrogenase complex n=1 Tax=Saccharomyces cerevisiae (strain Kyokai no. 7 / NBRC 101557) TaxID=721032 RepID=G2WM33_YEASK|nr:Lat1p [Saccharomyces cerevisiae YJM320]AJT07286.1 Lat1p [Saccharomyces cerevisiae YJM541]AJT08031.1 Lat1p [Saccharomyces cerevisiae YJM555]AJT19312.1 Lat1p [Saccharomyces cerevisiae YJM1307]AJT25232.1 Lat1p [Saccharomyces cerevisiae YJM1389]AJT26697.1 Lat1p [Saccharomyces cerevisiae YJM1402]AJT33718.1 Lat1p [Saccharomyces cerevisiae YJM1573]AJT34460.1 Lat1p [Saccharomyces cerevisiae YJM1592]KAF4007217.1 pyruvate dehydrogenase complex dihydrolipoamide acetyltransferase [Saccharomyces cere
MSAFVRVVPRISRSSVLTRSLRLQLRCYASYPEHTIIGMPALSPTMTQGNLASWTKKEGDQLSPGEVIAEIETDKAQMDFEFQEDGYLAKILVPEGTKDIPVNKPIAVYVEDKADVPAFKDFKLEDSGSDAKTSTKAQPAEPQAEKKQEAPAEETKTSAPEAKKSDVAAPQGRIFASPLAKTIALEKGISLKDVHGTGPRGRITKADIESYLEKSSKQSSQTTGAAAATPAAATSSTTAGSAPSPSSTASYEDVPISTMRSIIGERLLQSTQGIPSYIVSSKISVSKLLKLRQSLNATANDKYKLSINDLLVKAITVAAKRVPDANAYWLPNENVIRKFKNVDVSVAVATPTGLLTPIVKNCEAKGLSQISNEIKELVKRARINKLAPEEFQGGTICISNMGMNNAVNMFTSIINPPQSTILAIATVERVAVEDAAAENGFSFDNQVTITGTFDHRTIDGAKGAEFMKELKTVIENPLEMLL